MNYGRSSREGPARMRNHTGDKVNMHAVNIAVKATKVNSSAGQHQVRHYGLLALEMTTPNRVMHTHEVTHDSLKLSSGVSMLQTSNGLASNAIHLYS